MGVALNAAALGGVIVPVVGSINIKIVASLITAISMIALLIMGIKVREGIAVGNYRSTSNYSSISNSVERYNLKYIKIINKLQNYITRSFKRINLSNKRVLAILSTIDFHFYHRFE